MPDLKIMVTDSSSYFWGTNTCTEIGYLEEQNGILNGYEIKYSTVVKTILADTTTKDMRY